MVEIAMDDSDSTKRRVREVRDGSAFRSGDLSQKNLMMVFLIY